MDFEADEARRERERERAAPRRGDPFYVHLRDLRDALADALVGADGTWLDYGSDTAPYRTLLPRARLETADLASSGRAVDHQIDASGALMGIADGSFDGVLSTQVLEHVPDAAAYLAEAHRVLRPGGRLVVSTHGIWKDHPGPLDLRRWTIEGLEADAVAAGFDVERCLGLTCLRRAALFLVHDQYLASARMRPARRLLDWLSDTRFGHESRRPSPDASLYLGVLLVGRAPGPSGDEA